MRTKENKLLILLAGALVLTGGCGADKPHTAAAAGLAPAANSSSSAAAPVSSSAMLKTEDFLTVSGPLIVEHQVDVTAQRDGIVAALSADTGKRVAAGEVLARFDDRQLSANLEAARAKTRSVENDLKNWEAEAEVMQADYLRAQRLWNEKLIAEEQLAHAKFKAESEQWDIRRVKELLNTSRQEERGLELEMEKTRITAPFDGIVARRYVRVGQGVSKGDRLFWVTAEGPLRMRFTLPEKFIGHLKKGQAMPLSSPDVAQEQHLAKIISLSPVVDPSSGTIEVLVELTGARGGLRPGMTASVGLQNPQ
jgi:RND family efflux transporter MFP subunit